MKIRMRQRSAGPTWSYHAGQVVEVDNETGKALVASGSAEAVNVQPTPTPKPEPQAEGKADIEEGAPKAKRRK